MWFDMISIMRALRTIYCNTHVYTFHVCLCLLALTFVCNSAYLMTCSFQIYQKSIVVFIRSLKIWFKTTSCANNIHVCLACLHVLVSWGAVTSNLRNRIELIYHTLQCTLPVVICQLHADACDHHACNLQTTQLFASRELSYLHIQPTMFIFIVLWDMQNLSIFICIICDMQNYQSLILHITKTSSNNCLLFIYTSPQRLKLITVGHFNIW